MNKVSNLPEAEKFLVDFMLGRLGRWLVLLGEDAKYYRSPDEGGIIYRSLKEKRIILTRNRKLSRRKALDIYLVKSEEFKEQLAEVINKFDITKDNKKIFSRCIECNQKLQTIQKEKVKKKVPAYVYETVEVFSVCDTCQKIYWKGTHSDLIKRVLTQIKKG